MIKLPAIAVILASLTTGAWADSEEDYDLALQLSNPVADLISVPFQFIYDGDIGPNDGDRFFVNIQPVVPFYLDDEWNLISRTVLPVIYQDDVIPNDDQFGLGDTVQSLFFSPKAPTSNGVIWGAGPAFLLPTATDRALGGEKWGIGPTGVVLTQNGPWTVGALANHIWSFAGDSDRDDVNATFLQPFVTYTTPMATTFAINSEATYDWRTQQAAAPFNLSVNQIVKIQGLPVQIGAGLRFWAESSDTSPEGFGARLTSTFLFPR